MSARGTKKRSGSRPTGSASKEAQGKVQGQQPSKLEAVAQVALAGLPAADRRAMFEVIAKSEADAAAAELKAQHADWEQHRRERGDRHEQDMKDRTARRAQSVGTVAVALGLAVAFFVFAVAVGQPAAFGGAVASGLLSLRGALILRSEDPEEKEVGDDPPRGGD